MSRQTGILSIAQLLETQTQLVDFDTAQLQASLDADLAVHNATLRTLTAELCEYTTERERAQGTPQTHRMFKVDTLGRGPTQVGAGRQRLGLPLWKFQHALGWTRDWLEERTVADVAQSQVDARKAHVLALTAEIRAAVFGFTNYTFNDFLVDEVDLAVKRFLNADGTVIPTGPNGEAFDGSTHTHMVPNAGGLTATFLEAQITNLVEHNQGGQVRAYINRAQEATARALVGFMPYQDPNVLYVAPGQVDKRLDTSRVDNRAIGRFGAAEVWVKSWVPANYGFLWDVQARKPLAIRERRAGSSDLRRVAEIQSHPIAAAYAEAKFGVGVTNRLNGVAMYFGGGVYTEPAITAP